MTRYRRAGGWQVTDRLVRALKVACAVLLTAGVIGSIVLLGYVTNIFVASLAAATLAVGPQWRG
jgi:hypothetical protein